MANRIKLAGTTSNTFDIGINKLSLSSTSVTTPYTLTFPANVGSSNTFLKNDGTGNLTWSTAGSSNSISNGTSNVSITTSNGNITASVNGNSNIVVITDTGANVNGTLSVSGNANVGNLNATNGVYASSLSSTGNVFGISGSFTNISGRLTTGNQTNITSIGTLGALSVSGNANVGNIGTAGLITATGNINGGNLITNGILSVIGNSNVGNLGATGLYSTTISSTGNSNVGNLGATNGVFTTAITRNSRNIPTYVAQSSAPSTPLLGDQWYNSTTGVLYQYQSDGTSQYWQDMSTNVGTLANLSVSGTANVGTLNAGNLISIGTYTTVVGGTNRDVYVDDTGTLGYVSSIKASKDNIQPFTDTSWLLQLSPVSFNRRKKDKKGKFSDETFEELEYGLIAEDVEKVNEELCFYDKKQSKKTGKVTTKLAGVHYNKLIVPLLKLVQDQQQLITELSNRIEKIEKNNSGIEPEKK